MLFRCTWRISGLSQAEIRQGIVNFLVVAENLWELPSSDCTDEVRDDSPRWVNLLCSG
jgi:hypothetical protein